MLKIKSFVVALVWFVVFDYVWLGIVMKNFNMTQLAEIGRIENGVFDMNYPAALVTYLLMAVAVPTFILPRIGHQDSLLRVFFTGALMGLIIYGVFDMTNLAILKNYPVGFVAPDMAWGTFVFGLVTVVTAKMVPLKARSAP